MMNRPLSLQHRFVAGLGFRTRWTYRAADGRERTLPGGDGRTAADSPSTGDGGGIAARQAIALLGTAVPRSSRRRRPVLDEQSLASVLRASIPNAAIHTGMQALRPGTAGDPAILDALAQRFDAGDLILLRYVVAEQRPRWSLVSGMEVAVEADGFRPSALLLLDPTVPPVWACGYNARLEFTADRLLRRTVDGGLSELRLVSWLSAHRSLTS